MVKGTKRKIEIKKIEDRFSMATTFTKRSNGLYSKASQLSLLTGAQIAVLATPSSSQSNVSFYSFGHSSVEAVVSAFLAGKSPPPVPEQTKETREDLGICMARKDLGLGFWWDNDERFKTPQDTMEAVESMKTLLSHVRALRSDLHQNPSQGEEAFLEKKKKEKKKKNESDVVSHHDGTADQTLIIDHNLPPVDFKNDTTEHDQILSNSDSLSSSNNNKANLEEWSDMELDQLLKDSDDEPPEIQTGEEDHHQIMAISENHLCNNNNNNNALSPYLDEWSDMDPDQLLVDFDYDLPDEEEPIVWLSENTCNSNNALLTPAARNVEDEMGLDFQTIFEGLYSDEFAESLLMI